MSFGTCPMCGLDSPFGTIIEKRPYGNIICGACGRGTYSEHWLPTPTVAKPIAFKRLVKTAVVPAYATHGSAGMDLVSCHDVHVFHGQITTVSTGIAMAIPPGYEGQIRARSSLAAQGITIPNASGTIDSDYRGEIKVLLYNGSGRALPIRTGDRIAQLVIAPVVKATLVEVEELNTTARGKGGFGSTGQ